jgi:hypothetical protein
VTIVPQPPLERSVLERKERDELATIAEAMGVKPSARASKSTLIDHILREAGISDERGDAVTGGPGQHRSPRKNRRRRYRAC